MTERHDALPVTAQEFARLMSVPQDPRADGWRLEVLDANVSGARGDLRLRLDVVVTPAAGRQVERWEVTLPFDFGEASPGPEVVDTYVNTMRAVLEEWWYTKDQEPETAAWGRRLPVA